VDLIGLVPACVRSGSGDKIAVWGPIASLLVVWAVIDSL
jgi:hypothetical protein